jgi:hypothetical protein
MIIRIVLILSILFNAALFSQNSKLGEIKNISSELNTALVLFNAKLSVEFDYHQNDYLKLSLQPGLEFIESFGVDKTFYSRAPYYDLNLLGVANLFYNSDISIKPFIGGSYRINSKTVNRDAYFALKYGTSIQVSLSERFAPVLRVCMFKKKYQVMSLIYLV